MIASYLQLLELRKMLPVLFAISNLMIPVGTLIYKTNGRVRKQGQNICGYWFCFILYNLISNICYLIAGDNKLYMILDLMIKIGICFIPSQINANIQKKISYLHLEILYEKMRSIIIEKFYVMHSLITSIALSKMDDVEKKQFKAEFIAQLNKEQEEEQNSIDTKLSEKLNAAHKHFNNIGVTCDILVPQMLEKQKKQREKLQRALSGSGEKRSLKPTGHLSPPKQDIKLVETSEGQSGMKKKNSIMIQKSSTDLGIIDQEQTEKKVTKSSIRQNRFQRKNKQQNHNQTAPPKKKEVRQQKTSESNSLDEPSLKFEEQPSEILNKLDVSEYSDMFEENDEEFDQTSSKKLVSKVEGIVEIGSGPNIRLEIYNIELYSNDEIRIMSLYGREFQKHKLISISTQKHGYYQLKLEGGKVNKRRVKFRGKMDAFVKFLQPTSK